MATATAISTALPSGYHAPLSRVDADHHGGWVVICNAFGLMVIAITLLIRLYIRTKVSPPFSLDDMTLSAATFLAIIQSAIVFAQVHHGLGRSFDLIDAADLEIMRKLGYTADILYIIALYASKCCVVLLYKRIAPDRAHSLTAWTVLATCLVLGVASVFLAALHCSASHPWRQYRQDCSSLGAEWSAVAAFDIVTEIVLFGMSLHLVWGLQTSVARKGRVVFAFGLRLPVIAVAALRLNYIYRQVSSSNPSLVGAVTAVLTQVELFYGIMAATIPCLRPFLAGFTTNYGAMGGDTVMGGSQIGNSSKNRGGSKASFALTSMVPTEDDGRREKGTALRSRNRDTDESDFRLDKVNNQTSVTHGASRRTTGDASSIDSNDSTKMIIKKEVQWQIQSEGGRSRSRMDVYP